MTMRLCLTLFGLAFIGSGCLMVPKTTISGTLGGQPFALSSPKDSTLQGLDLSADPAGKMHLRIEKLDVKMNPDVVSMSGKAQVDIINAISDAVVSAAGKAAGTAAATAVTP